MDEMRTSVPATFGSEEYENRLQELQHQHNRRHRQAFEQLHHDAERNSIALVTTPTGFAFAPMNEEGEVIAPDAFQQLPEQERQRFQAMIEYLQNQLQELFQQFPQWQKEMQQSVRQLNEEMTLLAVGHPIEELAERYGDHPVAVSHLNAIRDDLVVDFEVFRSGEKEQIELLLHRYQANLLVHSEANEGAPVIYDDMPTHQRLVGRIEYLVHHGTLVTDFTQIRPGALHRANGEYLLLDVRKLLTHPFAWGTLKRTLSAAEIRPESLEKTYGFWTTASPEPEPVPLSVKVILLGDRMLYYLLAAHDPDFADLFKVEADLEDDLPADAQARELYARMIATRGVHQRGFSGPRQDRASPCNGPAGGRDGESNHGPCQGPHDDLRALCGIRVPGSDRRGRAPWRPRAARPAGRSGPGRRERVILGGAVTAGT